MRPLLASALVLLSAPAFAQQLERFGPSRLDGPRVGLTILDQRTVDKINDAFA